MPNLSLSLSFFLSFTRSLSKVRSKLLRQQYSPDELTGQHAPLRREGGRVKGLRARSHGVVRAERLQRAVEGLYHNGPVVPDAAKKSNFFTYERL